MQLPGREGRLREPALTSIPAIVASLVPALEPELDRPFALFGHSMGAVLAFEVARALVASGRPAPRHLFVSGRRAPSVPDADAPLRALPDAEFTSEIVRRYGGIPPEVLEHADLLALLLPTLRADIEALEAYRPSPGEPLPCPISALGGADDPRAPRGHLEAWRAETRAAFRARVFPGGHFYLAAQRAAVLADISATLA